MNLPQVPEGHQTEPGGAGGARSADSPPRAARPLGTPRTAPEPRAQPAPAAASPAKPAPARNGSRQPGHSQPATTITLHFNAKSAQKRHGYTQKPETRSSLASNVYTSMNESADGRPHQHEQQSHLHLNHSKALHFFCFFYSFATEGHFN